MFKFTNDITIHEAFIPLIPRYERKITRSSGLRSIIDWDTAIAIINFQYPRMIPHFFLINSSYIRYHTW